MDRSELYDLWQANKDRPAWVMEHRDELHEHTNTSDPIPASSIFDVRQWLSSYKPTVTRQLNDDADGTDPTDDRDDEGGESGETPTETDSVGST